VYGHLEVQGLYSIAFALVGFTRISYLTTVPVRRRPFVSNLWMIP
jgi:hypothetical protein